MNTSMFLNTLLPIVVLAGTAYLLPYLFVPRDTRSHKVVAMGVISVGGTVQLLSMLVFGLLYAEHGYDMAREINRDPWGMIRYFAGLADLSMILWLPALCFSWFHLAQRVERLRGDDMMRADTDQEEPQHE